MSESVNPTSDPSAKAPVSERKANANRANAQHSTGPRTAAGKARSSLNALRHGILARAAFVAKIDGGERRPEFDAILAGLGQEFQPQTTSEHLMVQQLAGCYWKLAKVWRYEQEAAWRTWLAPGIPIEEYNEYHLDEQYETFRVRDQLIEQAGKFLPSAGLDAPTIPCGASARTVLRYQGAITSMLFRTQAILERRRKERIASEEAFEEADYINEATEAAAAESKAAAEAKAAADAKAQAASANPATSPKPAEDHKRTQESAPDAPLSSPEEVKKDAEKPTASDESDPTRPGSA